jgi:hypothetical protein
MESRTVFDSNNDVSVGLGVGVGFPIAGMRGPPQQQQEPVQQAPGLLEPGMGMGAGVGPGIGMGLGGPRIAATPAGPLLLQVMAHHSRNPRRRGSSSRSSPGRRLGWLPCRSSLRSTHRTTSTVGGLRIRLVTCWVDGSDGLGVATGGECTRSGRCTERNDNVGWTQCVAVLTTRLVVLARASAGSVAVQAHGLLPRLVVGTFRVGALKAAARPRRVPAAAITYKSRCEGAGRGRALGASRDTAAGARGEGAQSLRCRSTWGGTSDAVLGQLACFPLAHCDRYCRHWLRMRMHLAS